LSATATSSPERVELLSGVDGRAVVVEVAQARVLVFGFDGDEEPVQDRGHADHTRDLVPEV
jgi:hypothetical protein